MHIQLNTNSFAWWDFARRDKPWDTQLRGNKICGHVIFDIPLRLSPQVDHKNDVQACKLHHKFWVWVISPSEVLHTQGPHRGLWSQTTAQVCICTFSFFLSSWQFYKAAEWSIFHGYLFNLFLSVLVCACVWFMWLSRTDAMDTRVSLDTAGL